MTMTMTKSSTPGAVRQAFRNDGFKARLTEALMGTIDGKAFAEHCIIAARDPNVAECTPESVIESFLTCAAMGLAPGPFSLVALIPRKSGSVKVLDVMPQWQGFKTLMERAPGIRQVTPVLVHTSDRFEVTEKGPSHGFDPMDPARVFQHSKKGDPGLRGGYLRILHDDGARTYHYVSAAKIERNRQASKMKDSGPWLHWFEEMCLKTVVRDAWARRAVPFDPCVAPATAAHLARAEQQDNRVLDCSPGLTYDAGSGEVVDPPSPTAQPVGMPSPDSVGALSYGPPTDAEKAEISTSA